jgi:hypothetical protein
MPTTLTNGQRCGRCLLVRMMCEMCLLSAEKYNFPEQTDAPFPEKRK